MPGMMAPGYMATQIDIIQSHRVGRRVVRMLKIDENPSARQQWQEETGGKGSIEAYYAELLGEQLNVKPSRESNVINITYKSAEPQFASAIANAFAQAYIDTNVELRADPAKQYAGWFDARTKGLREQLETAQGKLSKFQRDNGIINADERLDVENARLQELSSQLVAMQALRTESSSRQAQSGNSEILPEVLQSGLVQSLKADVARQDAKLKDLELAVRPQPPTGTACPRRRAGAAHQTGGRGQAGRRWRRYQQSRQTCSAKPRSARRSTRRRRKCWRSNSNATRFRCSSVKSRMRKRHTISPRSA